MEGFPDHRRKDHLNNHASLGPKASLRVEPELCAKVWWEKESRADWQKIPGRFAVAYHSEHTE